MTFAEV